MKISIRTGIVFRTNDFSESRVLSNANFRPQSHSILSNCITSSINNTGCICAQEERQNIYVISVSTIY